MYNQLILIGNNGNKKLLISQIAQSSAFSSPLGSYTELSTFFAFASLLPWYLLSVLACLNFKYTLAFFNSSVSGSGLHLLTGAGTSNTDGETFCVAFAS